MKLPVRRRRSKKAKALDAIASLAKVWTESKVATRAGKGVAKGAKKASSALGAALRSTPVKAAGAVALIGGVGAAVARKLKRGSEPDPFARSGYEPPDAALTTNGGTPPPVTAVPDPVGPGGVVVEPAPVPVLEPDAAAEETEALAAEEAAAAELEPVAEVVEPVSEEVPPVAEEVEPPAEEPDPGAPPAEDEPPRM